MFDDLDETIRQLLIAEMPVKNGEVEISFDQPKREWSARQSKPTLNLFLYDVRENNTLRHHQWEQLHGNGHDGKAHLKRTPFRVDCTYMLTTWASVPEDEHLLLMRAMMALFRFPVLPEERLIGSLRDQAFEIQAFLARHDRLTNPAEVWSALDNEIRPSVPYIVTLALDPWQEITTPIVRTRSLVTGQATDIPGGTRLSEDTRAEMHRIQGTLMQAGREHTPISGVEVAIKGTGLFTTTDVQGRFSLGSLPPGQYTLVAWSSKGKPKEKKVSIPQKEGSYDMEI